MATRKGKCTNFGNCPIADSKEILQIPLGVDMVCTECKRQLSEIAAEKKLPIKPIIGVLAGLAVIGILLWLWLGSNSGSSGTGQGTLGRPLRVGIVTWPGYAGGIVANNGFKPNKDCIYWSKHNLQVEFLLVEDVDVRNKAFAGGTLDIVWSTVDFWANELPAFTKNGLKARAIMQVDWSRGGDAIVADQGIRRVEDLAGKQISLALFTPSHWLLESSISNSQLTDEQQRQIVQSLVGKSASPDARADFVANKVDAAVVWEPDVTEALQKRRNSHIVVSTKTAANLIADIMVAREEFIKEHPDVIKKFIQGWLDGTAEANRRPEQVVKVLMENEPLYKEQGEKITREGLPTVKWADLTDNTQMFGLDGSEPLFDRIFKQASESWINRGYITQSAKPDQAKDDRFLKEIFAEGPVKIAVVNIPRPTAKEEVAGPIMSKPVNIFFKTGESSLDPNGQQLLDPVATLAQTYSNAYIRVEGNTDNVGDAETNRRLSKQRAQSVVDFLVDRYKFDRNRFITKGNGMDKPISRENTDAGRAQNRRTDVEIVGR